MGKYTEWILKELDSLKHMTNENKIASVARNLSLIYDIPIEISILAVKAVSQETSQSFPEQINHFFSEVIYYL